MQTKTFTIDLSEKTLVDITLVYVKTGKPKNLYLEGSIQPEIKSFLSKTGKNRTWKKCNKIFQTFVVFSLV